MTMTVLTVLCHGTSNSTGDHTLVITKIRDLLLIADREKKRFRINEGAGSLRLIMKGVGTGPISGIAGGRGVDENVDRSVNWIREKLPHPSAADTVNLAGHSRGSITCYKIAHALNAQVPEVKVNVFAIDPVPGNTGNRITRNGTNYENILLRQNVWSGHSFLMLAESDHRLVFRPYIDALYGNGLPDHQFDTIPGTHGGINTLGGSEDEAAQLVLSRALSFLKANGSPLSDEADRYILNDGRRLELYVDLMIKIEKYRRDASYRLIDKHGVSPSAMGNIFTGGLRSDGHRVVNVNGSKADFAVGDTSAEADLGGLTKRKKFQGLAMREALDRMRTRTAERGQAYAAPEYRFFCNLEHEDLFRARHRELAEKIMELERPDPASDEVHRARIAKHFDKLHQHDMSPKEEQYLVSYLRMRGVTTIQ
jgi:hypothetical protein